MEQKLGLPQPDGLSLKSIFKMFCFLNKDTEMSWTSTCETIFETIFLSKDIEALYPQLNRRLKPLFCYGHICIFLYVSFFRWFASTFKSTHWLCPWLFTWSDFKEDYGDEEKYTDDSAS